MNANSQVVRAPGELAPRPHVTRLRSQGEALAVSRVAAAHRIRHQNFDVLADELFARVAEQPLQLGVHQDDHAIRVDDEDAVCRCFNRELEGVRRFDPVPGHEHPPSLHFVFLTPVSRINSPE